VYPTTSTTTVAPTTTSTSTSTTTTTDPPTTTTTSTSTTAAPSDISMYWTLSPKNGGNGILSVLNSSNVEIFSQATGVTATSGTFTTAVSNAPLTVKMSWSAGSSNIVRYRICDGVGSEIYYGPDIDNALGDDSYALSPTPLSFYVYGTSGATTYPSICPS
jgi:hypothetical protein